MNKLFDYYSSSKGYLAGLQEKEQDYFRHYAEIVGQNVPSSGIVVDLGCGTGLSTRLLRKRNARTFGADISFLFLAATGDRNNFACDAQNLPLRDGSVDLVGAFEFIEHVVDAEKVMGEMLRITKPGGRILIMSPNLYSPLIPLKSLGRYIRGERNFSPWTPTFFSVFTLFFRNLWT
ncbi:class I SAM-dependent methyltransferase, partial [candidate division KSB1 bacterium]|nr:class I SAM-dependent methyltransferase [candidate division KSB1 bacterium]